MNIYTQMPSHESTLLYRTISSVFKFRLGAPYTHLALDNITHAFMARSLPYLSLSHSKSSIPNMSPLVPYLTTWSPMYLLALNAYILHKICPMN